MGSRVIEHGNGGTGGGGGQGGEHGASAGGGPLGIFVPFGVNRSTPNWTTPFPDALGVLHSP